MVFTPVRRIAMIYVVTGMTLEGWQHCQCLLSNADTKRIQYSKKIITDYHTEME